MNEIDILATQKMPMGGLATGMERVEDTLKRKRENLERQLEDVNKAIAILEKQPELLETLNLLRKVGI